MQQQKHRKGSVQGRVLAELLGDAIAIHYSLGDAQNLPDLLIPVPLHWRRFWTRGHNQSTLLANNLARRFILPVNETLVKRMRTTPSQQSLSARRRATNIAGAFAATPVAKNTIAALPNKRIAIVDDVVTTGATAQALAAVLLDAGAQQIHLWSPTRAILRQ